MPDTPPPATLPPGQILTRRWPVTGEATPRAGWDADTFRLRLDGLVDRPAIFSLADLRALPQETHTRDIHCVTGWSKPAFSFTGVRLAELLARGGGPLPEARFARFVAASARDHDTSLPLAVALVDCWLVTAADGAPLAARHGGPVRTVVPGRYFYKSLKWLERIELLAEDRPGYWERESAYHNNADPWAEERFDDARVATPETTSAFRADAEADATLDPWRERLLLRARLGGWTPAAHDLSRLWLKQCSLRRANLAGKNLRGVNFSLSNLEDASFVGADLAGADLEGASLAGADLTDTVLAGAWLSATRFYRVLGNGRVSGARVAGLKLVGCQGLVEDQAAWLRAQDATIVEG